MKSHDPTQLLSILTCENCRAAQLVEDFAHRAGTTLADLCRQLEERCMSGRWFPIQQALPLTALVFSRANSTLPITSVDLLQDLLSMRLEYDSSLMVSQLFDCNGISSRELWDACAEEIGDIQPAETFLLAESEHQVPDAIRARQLYEREIFAHQEIQTLCAVHLQQGTAKRYEGNHVLLGSQEALDKLSHLVRLEIETINSPLLGTKQCDAIRRAFVGVHYDYLFDAWTEQIQGKHLVFVSDYFFTQTTGIATLLSQLFVKGSPLSDDEIYAKLASVIAGISFNQPLPNIEPSLIDEMTKAGAGMLILLQISWLSYTICYGLAHVALDVDRSHLTASRVSLGCRLDASLLAKQLFCHAYPALRNHLLNSTNEEVVLHYLTSGPRMLHILFQMIHVGRLIGRGPEIRPTSLLLVPEAATQKSFELDGTLGNVTPFIAELRNKLMICVHNLLMKLLRGQPHDES